MSGFNEGIYERPVDETLNIAGQSNLVARMFWTEKKFFVAGE